MGEFPAGAVNRAVSSHRLVNQRPLPVLGSQHQILQALHQVGGDVDLAAPFHLVPRHLRPQADDWRVRGAEGQALRHPQPGPEHDSHGHPHRVDRVCGYQRRGLLRSEVVGGFWGFLAMSPPIRGDCSNQSARRGRPGAMSPRVSGRPGELVSFGPEPSGCAGCFHRCG